MYSPMSLRSTRWGLQVYVHIDERHAVNPATDGASPSQYLARLLAVQHVLSAQLPRMTPLFTCAHAAGIGILGLVVYSYNVAGDYRRPHEDGGRPGWCEQYAALPLSSR